MGRDAAAIAKIANPHFVFTQARQAVRGAADRAFARITICV
jgi:hypothetical protein